MILEPISLFLAKMIQTNYSHKCSGFVGGFALLVSNLTGPGLVSLSLVYQDSGWL